MGNSMDSTDSQQLTNLVKTIIQQNPSTASTEDIRNQITKQKVYNQIMNKYQDDPLKISETVISMVNRTIEEQLAKVKLATDANKQNDDMKSDKYNQTRADVAMQSIQNEETKEEIVVAHNPPATQSKNPIEFIENEHSNKAIVKSTQGTESKNPKQWTEDEVATWLCSLEGGKYARYKDAFIANEFDGEDFAFVCSNEGLLKDYGVKKPSHRHAIVKEIQQILSVEGTAQIRDGDLRNILEPCGSNSMSLLQYLDELSAAGFTTNTKLRTLTAERLKQNDIKMSVFHTKELLKRIAQLQLSSDYRLKPYNILNIAFVFLFIFWYRFVCICLRVFLYLTVV
eukprot:101213_1